MPLELRSRRQRLQEAYLGHELPPVVVPARTTLRIVELNLEWALALTPDGRHVRLERTTIRDHGYIPRVRGPRVQEAHSRAHLPGRTGGSVPDSQEGMCGGHA